MPPDIVALTSASSIPRLLRAVGNAFGPDISLTVASVAGSSGARVPAGECQVHVTWKGKTVGFVAQPRIRATPRVLDEACRTALQRAKDSGLRPMVVVPFLDEDRLDTLARQGMSGMDLNGNGIVVVPGRLMLRRSGLPNRFPETRPVRFAYRGATALVPRVFLRRPRFDTVTAVHREIIHAGGSVAMSTVSKALARMAEDLVIERTDRHIRLLQPDKLLDLLRASFVMPRALDAVQLHWKAPVAELFRSARAGQAGGLEAPLRLVMTGASSCARFTAGLRSDAPTLYASDLRELRQRLGKAWKPDDRFADLRVVETDDPSVFLDATDQPVPQSSAAQAYLELAVSGDRRDREMAEQVRSAILAQVAHAMHSPDGRPPLDRS
jgi:hypothetical protein